MRRRRDYRRHFLAEEERKKEGEKEGAVRTQTGGKQNCEGDERAEAAHVTRSANTVTKHSDGAARSVYATLGKRSDREGKDGEAGEDSRIEKKIE